MSLRDDLAGVLARDPRYTIQAYAFLFEALEFTKSRKKRTQARGRGRAKAPITYQFNTLLDGPIVWLLLG